MYPLPRRASRAFVLGFVALMLGLAVLAGVLITRGWADPQMQERVRQMEAEREASGG
jgi:hypothetical protein